MINLSKDEVKTILSSFYLWKNSDFSDLDRKFVNKIRSGIKKLENKLPNRFSEFTEEDVIVIQCTLKELISFLNDPDPEYDLESIAENKSFHINLIRSIAAKFSFTLDP